MAQEAGRLIKKNDVLRETIEMDDYQWLEFNVRSHLYPDNSRKSVIQTAFHDPQDLSEKVKKPEKFYDPLSQKSKPLFAVNLEQDYIVSQREMFIKKRRRMLDEEEAIAEELAELVLEEEELKAASQWETTGDSKTETNSQQSDVSKAQSGQSDEKFSQHANDENREQLKTSTQVNHWSEAELEQIKEEAFAEGLEQGRQDGFAAGTKEGFEKGVADGKNEGEKLGFEKGYLDGEQKGMLAAESKTNLFFQKLAESVSEVDKLRTEVLEAGREIFLEITKIASEKLLRTQLAFDSKTLNNFYHKALDTYRDRELVSFEMNPQDAQKFREWLKNEKDMPKVKIKENPDLQTGDFKMEVDSELAVNDLKKSVESLIKEVSSQIFDETNSGKKVG